MPRWEPDAIGRLQEAAFALFSEQGFDRTTIAEIAQRAGLTERTFFNHFADKREVLFGPVADQQREAIETGIANCLPSLGPLEAAVTGLQAAAETVFEGLSDAVVRRRRIVEANPELHERELRKQAALTDVIALALRERGADPDTALLAARTAIIIHQTAMQHWAESAEGRALRDLIADALDSLRGIVAR